MDHFLPKMLAGFLIRVISIGIWIYKCTGVPIVSLTASSSPYIDIGGSMTLTCSINEDVQIASAYLIKNGINYVWIRPNTSSGCGFTKLTGSDPHTYNGTCEQNMKTNHIIINRADASDHNATWGCSMTCQSCSCPGAACVSISSVRTALRILVSSVQLTDGTGQQLVTPVSVLDGSNMDFRCDTSPNGSRPQALFEWYKRSENQSPILIQDQAISTPGPKPEYDLSISISYSRLTLMGSRSYRNMYIYCEVQDETNRGNATRSREVQLNIVYHPVVQLFPNTSSWNVTEESPKFDLRCNVTDANPMPQIDGYSWLFGGRVLQGQNRSSLELFNVHKSQDGVYQCMAKNEYGIGNSSTMHLNVHYGPTISLTNYTTIEGENVSIACNVTANPQPDIVWSRNGTIIQPSSDSLKIPNISRLQDGDYTCRASNVLYPTGQPPVLKNATDVLRISVLYPPIVNNFTSPVKAIQGQPLEVVCSADGNPPPQVTWNPAGEDRVNKSRLYYSAISMDKAVVHTCTATNNMVPPNGSPQLGFDTKKLLIDILCIPSVPTNVIVGINGPDSVTLEWTSGIDLWHPQEFVIQYRIYPDGDWVKLNPIKETGSTKQSVNVKGLLQKTTYEFHLYVENLKEPNNNISVIVTTIEMKESAFPVGAVAGSISGTLVACVCVVVVIIFLWQRGQRNKKRGATYESVDDARRSSNKENAYDSLNHDKMKTSDDSAYENTGASASLGNMEIRKSPKDENMEMTSRNN